MKWPYIKSEDLQKVDHIKVAQQTFEGIIAVLCNALVNGANDLLTVH